MKNWRTEEEEIDGQHNNLMAITSETNLASVSLLNDTKVV